MKRLRTLFQSVLAAFKKRKYHSLAALLLLVAAVSLVTVLTTDGHARQHAAPHKTNKPVHTTTATNTQPGTPQPGTAQLADQQSTASAAPTVQNSAVSSTTTQRTLQISPSTFTVVLGDTPGASNQSISIRASNDKALNMPGFSDNNNGKFIFNFPAGPAKQSWDGQLMTFVNAPVGTYTLGVFAQDNTTAFYRGTITVTVVRPTMDITVQSLGYDAENDAVSYIIKTDRQYGFDEPVTEVAASSTTEPGLGCYYEVVDDSNIAMACGHTSGDRPTSGTLTIQVATDSLVRTVTASYSLPPLP